MPGLVAGLVAPLIHAGDAVVPAEAVVVEPGPEKADAERAGGEDGGEDAAAHGRAGRVVVGEGAERDAGVTHAGGRFSESEEQKLVEQGEHRESAGSADGGCLQSDVGRGCPDSMSALEFADGEGEGRDEDEECGGDDTAVDGGSHEAQAEGRGLGREDGLEGGFGNLYEG